MPPKIGEVDSGVEIEDLLDVRRFRSRRRKVSDPSRATVAMTELDKCFSEHPESMLQTLIEIAAKSCNADSSGISLEEQNSEGKFQFRWVVVTGSFAKYLNGTTPRFYSPCGTCLDRGVAQHYRIMNPYYNFLGVTAEPILDGMLIPWRSQNSQGTIWVVSHRSEDAFDADDYEFVQIIATHVAKEMSKMKF